jgi:hypothetical protein
MDGANLELTVFKQLRNAQALGARESEIKLACDAFFKDIEVLAAPYARHDHMQVVNFRWADFREHAGKEIRLLLVVPFKYPAIAWGNQSFQHINKAFSRKNLALHVGGSHAPLLL